MKFYSLICIIQCVFVLALKHAIWFLATCSLSVPHKKKMSVFSLLFHLHLCVFPVSIHSLHLQIQHDAILKWKESPV